MLNVRTTIIRCFFAAVFLTLAVSTTQADENALRVRADRIEQHIIKLSQFGKNSEGGVSRVAFSAADIAGRQYVVGLMQDAGLKVRIDTAGNIIGHKQGSDPELPVILFGSHIDSVPGGGNYDGDVGVISAIEIAQVLQEHGPIIICEVLYDHTDKLLQAMLENSNYKYFFIKDEGLVPTEKIVGDPEYHYRNYLFVPKSKLSKIPKGVAIAA